MKINLNKGQIKQIKDEMKSLFSDINGKPFQATDHQAIIFWSIVDEDFTRVAIRATTQYGKSEVASMAINYICASSGKKVVIVAPRIEQAKIIMTKLITHIYGSPVLRSLVEYEGSWDRFKRERSKKKIDWKTGASVMILTSDATSIAQEGKALMGFGADIVVADESSLIPDKIFSKILRMVGGIENGKLIQLGNPFEKNHFFRAFQNDKYYHIVIDYKVALREKRLTREFLDEAKSTLDPIDWQIFYESEFPDETDDSLIPYKLIDRAINREEKGDFIHWGIDIARFGSDRSVLCKCQGNSVIEFLTWQKKDTMESVGIIKNEIDEYNPNSVNVDVIGIGSGVVDRLTEENYSVNGVNFGASASNIKYSNVRAEAYWHLRELFIEEGISIPNDAELIRELEGQKYKFNSSGQILIEDKDKIKQRLGRSPDKADALALAFLDVQPVTLYPSGTIA